MAASHKEISNILAALEALVPQGVEGSPESAGMPIGQLVLATVVDVEGSAYRRTGARMLIQHNGQWTGSISGGCLEGNALRQAREVMQAGKPRLVTYDTRNDEAAKSIGASLGCNGVIQIWIEPLEGYGAIEMLRTLKDAFMGREERWFARLLDGPESPPAVMLKTTPTVMLKASLQSNFLSENIAAEVLSGRQEGLHTIGDQILAIEQVLPATRLLIFGAGDDVRPLVQLGHQLGWRVIVTDDCPAKTIPARFPEAEQVIHLQRAEAARTLTPDAYTAAVLISHNYAYDRVILEGLLPYPVPYIGILGPRSRFERLVAELGETLADNPAIHAPIGLDIGAQAPFEIALAIVAEIQAVFSARNGGHLKDRPGTIHARKALVP